MNAIFKLSIFLSFQQEGWQNGKIYWPIFQLAELSLLQDQLLMLRLVLRQKGKIYWPIFQLAELVFFRAST